MSNKKPLATDLSDLVGRRPTPAAAPAEPAPVHVPFSNYITPENLRRLKRMAYWGEEDIKDVFNRVIEDALRENEDAQKPTPKERREK